ncbi:NAD(P)-binding protein [Hyaloscypha variabilis F]|uniref:NAD(P)-binding protein n=1 Tax=Hyaloscypha variabilis (strain UAMH 11265 / GT02V1 / F) TaxID=1149755 RepID=A0A2J6S151_HYAVF|nr:NAD(P)-binding protein [Hyaloscypha variabilis F]
MPKTIAILGVTGTQGGSVASHFFSLGWHVRGLTRPLTSASSISLKAKGIEVVQADIDSPSSLLSAFRGAHVIFGLTDFWGPYFSVFNEKKKEGDRATGEYAYEIEVRRGKNIVDAVEKVLEEEGSVLERFVLSSLPGFKAQSGGKYTFVYHFDSKAVVTEYLRGKGRLWERSSVLNMGFYADNLVRYGGILGAAKDMENGVYIWRKPCKPTATHPFVIPSDTGFFVELLVNSPPKQDLLGVSEMASYADYMKIWSEVTGVPSEVREISVEEADMAAPGGVGREAAESTATSAEFGWGEQLVLPTQLDPEFKTTSLRGYIEGEDWKGFLSKI